jgi:tetratricopeptide (TPR) repeat protein
MRSLRAFLAMGLTATASIAVAEEPAMEMKVLRGAERKDRVIDQAAVAIQREGIRRIENILKSKLPASKESDLMFQLGVARLEAASIQFRISHERAHRGNAKLDLSSYNTEMLEAVKVLTNFLGKFPKDPRTPEVIFLRGTAYDESNNKKAAQRDFEDLVKRFPEVPETSPALMRLADFAVEDEDHARAVRYLTPLEKRVNDPHHPFALYKLAWAHFNLTHIRTALDYLGKHIHYYDSRFQKYASLESSEMAIRDNSLRDISLFLFEGVQKDMPGFHTSKAFQEFKKYAGLNPTDSMVVRFTGLIRARNNTAELEKWADIIDKSSYKPETRLLALNVLFENQQNRRLYAEMEPNMARLKKIMLAHPELEQTEASVELKRVVEQGAKDLHAAIQENKNSPLVSRLVGALEDIYGLVRMLSIKDKSDSVKSYFNLAETYFELKDYPKATEYYRKAYAERLEIKKPSTDLLPPNDFFMRALASRFEELRSSKEIRDDVKALALGSSEKSASLSARFNEWSGWLSQGHQIKDLSEDDRKVLRRYEWDRQRTVYASGRRDEVIAEIALELKDIRSLDDFTEPKLDLWMDTLVASESWSVLHEITKKWNKKTEIKKTEIAERIQSLESDSFIKQIENDFKSGDTQTVLAKTAQCEKDYRSQADRVLKCQVLAAEVLASTEQWQTLVSKLDSFPKSLDDAKIENRVFDLRLDAYLELQRYEDALAMRQSSSEAKHEEIFELGLMVQSSAAYRRLVDDKSFCSKNTENCRVLRALLEMRGEDAGFRMNFSDIFRAHRPYRSVYSLASVGSFRTSLVDRMKVFRNAVDNWRHLDSRIYWSALPELENWIDKELKSNRELLSRNYPLRAENPNSLATRFSRIRDFEQSLEALSKTLPLSSLRAMVLRGAAGSYEDVVAELKGVMGDAAAGFVKPLEDKRGQILAQAKGLESVDRGQIDEKLAAMRPHLLSHGEVKAFNDLSKGRWVAAKMRQDTLRKERKLSAFGEAYLNASFFQKLGAWNEASEALKVAEEHLHKVIVSQQTPTGDLRGELR